MNETLVISLIGCLVGTLGAGLGAILAVMFIRPSDRVMGLVLGITSGVMLAVVTFDLLPESFNIGGLWIEILGVFLGMLIMFFVENLMDENSSSYFNKSKNQFTRAGILLGIGIGLHNFPEGLAIGSSFIVNPKFGLTMAAIIALHDLPEGMAVAIPLKIGGMSNIKIFLLSILTGIPTGIGAFLGALLGNISDQLIALCLAFAGGAMLYITCGELIPNAKGLYKGRFSTIGIGVGFLLGMFISGVI